MKMSSHPCGGWGGGSGADFWPVPNYNTICNNDVDAVSTNTLLLNVYLINWFSRTRLWCSCPIKVLSTGL